MSDIEKNSVAAICDFFDDGYTRECSLEAIADAHGPLTFTYRPAVPEQVSPLLDAQENDVAYMKYAIDTLAKLLLTWSLKNQRGEVVKVNRENIARVNRKLLVKIIDRVFFNSGVEAALKN